MEEELNKIILLVEYFEVNINNHGELRTSIYDF